MDDARFDAFARSATVTAPRRSALGALALAALGLALGRDRRSSANAQDAAPANRRRRVPVNRFGCLNVGQKYRGKDRPCCSGR